MRRIGLALIVGLSLFAVPLAEAQQAPKIIQIGILSPHSPHQPARKRSAVVSATSVTSKGRT